jgi:hypothetical protein
LSGSTFSDSPLADAIRKAVAISDEKRYIMGKEGGYLLKKISDGQIFCRKDRMRHERIG